MDEPTCAVDGCDKRSRNRGWCSGHYERWRLTGDVQADVPLRMLARPYPPGAKCAIEGCEDRPSSRNWCEKHYEQWRRFGDPLFARKVIGDDLETLEANVDRSTDPDACHLWTGRLSPDGYGWAKKDGSWTLAHIAAWEFENGVRPSGAELDHECHNRAVREGTCRPGKCAHRRCCNLSHIVLRTSKREHYDVTVPWDRSAWAYSITLCNTSDTEIPAAATEKTFPLAMDTGCPVHDPNRYRVASVLSHISIPTIDQVPPDPFVHDAVLELDVAAADAALNVVTVPPVVYPVPPPSWVMFAVAVGALVPSSVFTVAGVVNELLCRTALSRLPAAVWSKHGHWPTTS
jgi:hypothetical protein